MSPLEILTVGGVLVVALLLGRLLARGARVPDAAAYVLIGVAAGLLPWLPHVRLSPDLVLLVLLPPLVWYAAFFSDPRETVSHIGPIVGQSVGLVLVTAGVAAGCLIAVFPQVGWAAALAFGAAVAPPDPVAATSVLDRLGVPSRLITVLEGEGLVNDGAALTLFGIAVLSIDNTPSPGGLAIRVAVEIGGGLLFGLVVGVVVTWVRARIRDVPSQVVLSLATPYLAFVPTQLAHASGVLATVVAAVWQGTRGRGLVAPTARLQTETFWRVLNTLLVAALFVLLGLQVPAIVSAVRIYPTGALVAVALAVALGLVVIRLAWALLVAPVLARLPPGDSAPTARMPRSERVVLGWCGPRGAVSLAVALSLPLALPDGSPFTWRPLLLFLTIIVVLVTLVGQVLTLPALLRWLKLSPSQHERLELLHARRAATDAALRQLDDAEEHGFDRTQIEALRQTYELRRDRLVEELDQEPSERQRPRLGERELQLDMVRAQREALRRLRSRREIGGRTLVQLSQELDLDETRLRGPGD